MTEHYSPMSITQLIHSGENQPPSAETSHHQTTINSSSPTKDDDYESNKHDYTLPPLLMHSAFSSSPLPTSSSCLSETPHFSSCSDDSSSTCQGKNTFNPTILSTNTIPEEATQNGRAESYGKRTCLSLSNNDTEDKETLAATYALARTSLVDEVDGEGQHIRQRTHRMDVEEIRTPRSRPHSRSTSPHGPYIKSGFSAGATTTTNTTTTTTTRHRHQSSQMRHGQSKSNQTRWQQLVIQAGSAAGTTAAVVSEESMKCLRYCLHWLQYATQHIQQQMHLLRLYLVSLATGASSSTHTTVAQQSIRPPSSSPSLSSIQHEIIITLRKVVEVVSRYAGTGLPTHAKASIRSFILQLPGRWATLNTNTAESNNNRDGQDDDVHDHVKETSIKLLNFGGESIEMLESVSSVFSDSIDRAQLWLERLRLVNVTPPATTKTHPDAMEF